MNAPTLTLATALGLLALAPAPSSAQGTDYAGPNYLCTSNRLAQASKETIIRTIRLTEMQAQEGGHCAQQCNATPNCRGFNQVHSARGNSCVLLSELPKTYPFPGEPNIQFGAVCMRRSLARTPGDDAVPSFPGNDWRVFQETRPGDVPAGKK